MAKLSNERNSKISSLQVRPESLISSRFVNIKSRSSEFSCYEMFYCFFALGKSTHLVFVSGNHCTTVVILFLLCGIFLVPSLKKTNAIFLDLFLLQY